MIEVILCAFEFCAGRPWAPVGLLLSPLAPKLLPHGPLEAPPSGPLGFLGRINGEKGWTRRLS